MASAPVMFIPQNGNNVFIGGQAMPGTVVQPAATVQYVQYVPQPIRNPINQTQQSAREKALMKFFKLQPKTLGAIQIMTGLIHIGFGAVSAAMFDYFYSSLATIGAYPFWGGIFFIASGSISVSVEKHPTPYMVQTSVGMNITSAVMASVGIILYCVEFPFIPVFNHGYQRYGSRLWYNSAGAGISALLFVFSLLEFGIAVTSAHFGCKAVCCTNDTETIFVPYVVPGTNMAPAQHDPDPPPGYDFTTAPSKME